MEKFKVVQFNMQFGQVWDETDPDGAPIDVAQTIAELRSHDADIILLQEVEQGQLGGAQIEPPPNCTKLRRGLDGYDCFFSYPKADPRELPFGIGLAIFSKTPLRDTMRRDLPSPQVEFDFEGTRTTPTDRLLIGGRTVVCGRELQIFNTHLLALFMITTSSLDYPMQRRRVLENLRASQGPTLLGGDFNVAGHEALARQFATAGYRTVQTAQTTWRREPFVLDHVFYSSHLCPLRHVVKPTTASDHHVLVVEFEFVGD
jgi:endonuclease/exonuclease/phosphatase family metal-dependent hydrolase